MCRDKVNRAITKPHLNMEKHILLPLETPAVTREKVTVAFDGAVLLFREVERQLGFAARLATCLTNRRNAARVDHTVVEMLKLRMFAIAVGYGDAGDCDALRQLPVFKVVGRTPGTGQSPVLSVDHVKVGQCAVPGRD